MVELLETVGGEIHDEENDMNNKIIEEAKKRQKQEKDRIEKAMRTYQPNRIPRLERPIIYGWKRNDQYLYVGKSKKGTERILGNNIFDYRVIEGDLITIWPATIKNIDFLEIYFIRKYNPKYNLTYSENSSPNPLFDEEGNKLCLNCKKMINGTRNNKKFCDNKCRNQYWENTYDDPGSKELRKLWNLLREFNS